MSFAMSHIYDPESNTTESEPVLVEKVGAWVRLTLDDGTTITLPLDQVLPVLQSDEQRAA